MICWNKIHKLAKNNGERTLKPLSKKTILGHHRLISSIQPKVVYWQLILYNPTDGVQPPRAPSAYRHISIHNSVIEILEKYKLWYVTSLNAKISSALYKWRK